MFDPNVKFNTPSNTPNWSTGGNYGSNIFSSLAGKAGNYINNNPEQFAIAADYIGSNLAKGPTNPMAGLGTMLGQSSLANKASDQTVEKENILMKLIKGLSAKNMPGGNQLKITTGPDGKPMFQYEHALGDVGDLSKPIEGEVNRQEGKSGTQDPHAILRSIAVE